MNVAGGSSTGTAAASRGAAATNYDRSDTDGRAGGSHHRDRLLPEAGARGASFALPERFQRADLVQRIISMHSFRGGTGKSNSSANVATILAQQGCRVAVVDADIQSPGVHVIFGIDQKNLTFSLNDYLWGQCDIAQTAHDVTASLSADITGKVFLVPSSIDATHIARVMRDGYDVGLLNDGFRALIQDLALDALIIDTHPGLNEETLLSIAMSDVLVIILRPDQQDYEGTSVTVSVARRLHVPKMFLVVNKTPDMFDPDDVRERVEAAYQCHVAAVLPHSDDMMVLSSSGVFALRYPLHPITALYRVIAGSVME